MTQDAGVVAMRLVLANLAEDRMGDDQKVLDDIGDDVDRLRDTVSRLAYYYAWDLIHQHGRDKATNIVMDLIAAGVDDDGA